MFTVFIKEMRQLRRDPVVWSAVGAQLAFGLIALVRLFYLPASELKSATETFIGFVTICGAAAALLIIGLMAARWSRELKDEFMNSSRTTPLSPFAVVGGKFLATWCALLIPVAAAQLLLSFRAAALPEWYWRLLLPLAVLAFFSTAAVMLAASSVRFNVERGSGTLIPLGGSIVAAFVLIPASLAPLTGDKIPVEIVFYVVMVQAAIIAAAFALTVAAAAPSRSDRMLPVRIVVLLSVLILPWAAMSAYGNIAYQPWAWCFMGAVFSLLCASQERRRQSRRVAAEIGRAPQIWRPFRWLFSTGAVPGLVFALLLAAVAFAAGGIRLCRTAGGLSLTSGALSPSDYEVMEWAFGDLAVLFFYVALTLFILELGERSRRRRTDPLLVLLLTAAVCMIVPAIAGAGPKSVFSVIALWHYFGDPESAWCEAGGLFVASLLLLTPTVRGFVRSCRADR